MRDLLQDKNITYFPSKPQMQSKIDRKILDKFGFQILRDFGTSSEKLKNFIMGYGYRLFYTESLNGWLHTFETQTVATELSEELEQGGFHTDFMFQKEPPRYIALQCIKPDPKYPLYGRNQIVKIDNLINAITKCGVGKDQLRELQIEYVLKGKIYKQNLFDDDLKSIKYHQKFASNNIVLNDDLKIVELINNLSLSICEDIVLNSGDLLLIDNHTTLHRRSECSVRYDFGKRIFEGRKMNSARFN